MLEPEHLNALAPILSAVQRRSTKKPEDETLCIASILLLPKTTIIAANTAPERMEALLQVLSGLRLRISTDILFYPEPKLQLEGYRWAPASLMTTTKDVNKHLLTHPLLRDYITNEGSRFDDCGLQCDVTGYELGLLNDMAGRDVSVVFADAEGRPGIWRAVDDGWNIGNDPVRYSKEQGSTLHLIFDNGEDEFAEFGLAATIYQDEKTASGGHGSTAGRVYARYLFRIARCKEFPVSRPDDPEPLHLNLATAKNIEGVTWCIG